MLRTGVNRRPPEAGRQCIDVTAQRLTGEGASEPEVDDFDLPGRGIRFRRAFPPAARRAQNHHVARLEITMNDIFRVDGLKTQRDLFRQANRQQRRQRAPRAHPVAQRLASNKLHREKWVRRVLAEKDHTRDI